MMGSNAWMLEGKWRFDRFMEQALYHPEHGYYSKNIRTVGRRGDFSTTTTLSPSLARAIGHWILTTARDLGLPLRLIEIGAGDGSLAAALLKEIGWYRRLRCAYHIVESSPPLRAIQKKRLGGKAHWHESPISALNACSGIALIFHNEVPDAFPARVFRKSEHGWEELFLDLKKSHAEAVWKATIPLPESTALDHKFEQGQQVEVIESFHQWLSSWTPHWKQGEMLTIDYGDAFPKIYNRRPNGTLRGYHQHHMLSGSSCWQHPGRIDLTTDVNFSDLKRWGESLGLETLDFQYQADFLRPFATKSLEDQYLIDMAGPGREFKVLRQVRRKPR